MSDQEKLIKLQESLVMSDEQFVQEYKKSLEEFIKIKEFLLARAENPRPEEKSHEI